MLDQCGVTLFDALRAFFQEHEYCGELDAGIEGARVWVTRTCEGSSTGTRTMTDRCTGWFHQRRVLVELVTLG